MKTTFEFLMTEGLAMNDAELMAEASRVDKNELVMIVNHITPKVNEINMFYSCTSQLPAFEWQLLRVSTALKVVHNKRASRNKWILGGIVFAVVATVIGG
jgi:fucose 4-O-acetylase-like acetyltransferase